MTVVLIKTEVTKIKHEDLQRVLGIAGKHTTNVEELVTRNCEDRI